MSRDDAAAQVVDAAGQDRLADDLGRVVALVGDADQLVAEAEGADDLGRRRKEGDDAHRTTRGTQRRGLAPGGRGRAREAISPGQRGFSSSTAARAAALSVNQVASIAV